MGESYRFDLGYREAVLTNRFENGLMNTYSHSVIYDHIGAVIEQTEPYLISSIGYDNGHPFNESDYNKLNEVYTPKQGFFSRMINKLKGG